jgi:hypothetical protein
LADAPNGYLLYHEEVIAVFSVGGVPLASSRGTSNGPDVQDVTYALLAFESINQVEIVITIRRRDSGTESVLELRAEAYTKEKEGTEATLLASTRHLAGSNDRRTMDAAIMQLTYKLDALLATGEFGRVMNK